MVPLLPTWMGIWHNYHAGTPACWCVGSMITRSKSLSRSLLTLSAQWSGTRTGVLTWLGFMSLWVSAHHASVGVAALCNCWTGRPRNASGCWKVKLCSILILWLPICHMNYAIKFPLNQKCFIYLLLIDNIIQILQNEIKFNICQFCCFHVLNKITIFYKFWLIRH